MKEKLYITLTKNGVSHLICTFVIESDGSFYHIGAEKKKGSKTATDIIASGTSGMDSYVLGTGTVKHSIHPDGRSHTQTLTEKGFRTVNNTIQYIPPYSARAEFRMLSLNLMGKVDLAQYPIYAKATSKPRLDFDYEVSCAADSYCAFIFASVNKGEKFEFLDEAIKYACSHHNLDLTPHEHLFYSFDSALPPLFVLTASKV
jgi:hypothetical protein